MSEPEEHQTRQEGHGEDAEHEEGDISPPKAVNDARVSREDTRAKREWGTDWFR